MGAMIVNHLTQGQTMRQLSVFVATSFCFIPCGIFPLTSQAQTYCSNLGLVVICDGGRTTITPLGPYGGVITDDERGVTPYAILPSPDRAERDRRDLERLDRLETRRDRLDDELRLPFDLERGDGLMLLPE
jgi:hypothetical protein